MNPSRTEPDGLLLADDVCSLALVRRLAALLDHDPALFCQGDRLPHGWHPLLFNTPTRQSELRLDGAPGLGADLPDLGLPRLMIGGRRARFPGEILIGESLRRETRRTRVQEKTGRSGRFAVVTIEHRIFGESSAQPVLIEEQDYLLREAATSADPGSGPGTSVGAGAGAQPATTPASEAIRVLTVDEALLFRYSAMTDNPHRIHYDHRYTTEVEGYPALVVNGTIPAMFLLEMFREASGREPMEVASRNVAPMFCGETLQLHARQQDGGWRLWATKPDGVLSFDAQAH